jgi:hypothetical protein
LGKLATSAKNLTSGIDAAYNWRGKAYFSRRSIIALDMAQSGQVVNLDDHHGLAGGMVRESMRRCREGLCFFKGDPFLR